MISGSIQVKKGNCYAVLVLPTSNGKNKIKWVSMGMKATESKRKQKQRLDEIRVEYSGIASIEAIETKFCDLIVKWNEETKEDKSITTYDNYCHMINKYIYPYFSDKGFTLMELRPADIQAYYRHLKNLGLSGKTAVNHHQIIFTSLKYAVLNRIIKENPAEFVKRPKIEKTERETYSADELVNLIEAAKGDVLESVIFLTLLYGLRREEILGLKWTNIDFERHQFRICETVVRGKVDGKWVRVERHATKTATSNRLLPLNQQIETYLQNLRAQQESNRQMCGDCYINSDFVCVNTMGEPINPDYVTHHYSDLLKKSGLKKIRFHDLRHSCASFLYCMGFTSGQIQDWLGHYSESFTKATYIHPDMTFKFEMLDRLTAGLIGENE
ncbi:MAG: site-specific integrase [Clostridia bacterium]|nr:site-specific integrase [Clostridia bacterium]